MTDVVRDAIAASIAGLTRVNATPAEPYGYGSDISCDSDVDAGMAELPGDSTLLLAQAIARRLDTPRGSLPDDPGYGISLRSMLNVGTTTTSIAGIAGRIRGEIVKDDRVATATVSVTPGTALDSLTVVIRVTPADVGETFTMTLAVTSSATLLEAIS